MEAQTTSIWKTASGRCRLHHREAKWGMSDMVMNGGGGGVITLRDKVSHGRYPLYGVIIYSDADIKLIDLFKTSHLSLSTMSGENMFMFWFEHFEKDSIILWKIGDDPEFRKPSIRRSESLKLAKSLSIPMAKTPCMLICRHLEDKESLIYSFDSAWSPEKLMEHFRAIFDEVDTVMKDSIGNEKSDIMDSLGKKLRALKIKKWVSSVISNQSIGTLLKAIATG